MPRGVLGEGKVRAPRGSLKAIAEVPRPCVVCGAEFRSIRAEQICCSRVCGGLYSKPLTDAVRAENARARLTRTCEHCQTPFQMRNPSGRARRGETTEGQFCSVDCSNFARGMVSGEECTTRRRTRVRAARVEPVNALTVLERDGWRCCLCGRSTPKRLRGTFDPRAPEIDHIVPIAAGGEHSYRNVQCACRECNIKKSGKPLGQMRLFG